MNPIDTVEGVLRDARHALRMLRRNPSFSIAAVLTLALGIGTTTAIFSVVNGVLIRPLPYPDSDQLIGVFASGVVQGQPIHAELSPGMFAAYRQSGQVFQQFGVWSSGTGTVTGIAEPEEIPVVILTQGVLPALAVKPLLGRWFSVEDDTPGSPSTAILSHRYWQRRFGGSNDAIGRTLTVDSEIRQIVGVMPPNFRFLDRDPDVILPQRFPSSGLKASFFNYPGIARLKPGVTVEQAKADMRRAFVIWGESDPEARRMLEQLQATPFPRPLKESIVGDLGADLLVLMGALTMVMLLVCANVANLKLVRAQSRQTELAIRSALGAGWGRISRELFVESLTLGVLGGAFGLAIASGGVVLLVTNGPASLARLQEVSIDGWTIGFVLAWSLGSSLLIGLLPVLRYARPTQLADTREASHSLGQRRAQDVLVIIQVALALVLLVASGLMIRTFQNLQSVKPGFERPEHIQTVRLSITPAEAAAPSRVVQMQIELLERLGAIPGVEQVAFASGLPLDQEFQPRITVAVEGRDPEGQIPPARLIKLTSPGLLAVQGTPMLAGRDFNWDDVHGQRAVAIVSEALANETWGSPSAALGKRIRVGQNGVWSEVVGIAGDVHEIGLREKPPAMVYLRAGLEGSSTHRSAVFAMRTSRAGSAALVQEVSEAVRAVSRNLPLTQVRTFEDVLRISFAQTSFTLLLVGIAGAIALFLGIIGVYGVLAHAAGERRREVSIRLALGAEPKCIRTMFLRYGLLLACLGSAAGLLSAVGLSHWMASLLFGIDPLDPPTYVTALATILATASAASYLPASRAASANPLRALRDE